MSEKAPQSKHASNRHTTPDGRRVFEMGEALDGTILPYAKKGKSPQTPEGGWASVNPEVAEYEAEQAALAAEAQASPYTDEGLAQFPDDHEANVAAAKEHSDRLDSISDLASIDDNGYARKSGIHAPRGGAAQKARNGQFMSEKHVELLANNQDQVRDGLDERAKELALFEQSKALAPHLDAIEAELGRSGKTQVEVLRAALVAADIYGKNTALKVGNMTDEEVEDFYQYAQSTRSVGAAKTVNAPLTVQPLTISTPSLTAPSLTPPKPSSQHAPLTVPPLTVSAPAPLTVPSLTPAGAAPLTVPPLNLTPNQLSNASPELIAKRAELDAVRTVWAQLSAKRHRKAFGGRSAEYEQAEREYTRLSREVAKLELADQLANETDVAQKNALVTMHWIEEQNKVRAEATHHVEDRRWWKIVNGFSNFMNKGSAGKRFAKGMTLGFAAGLLGGLTGGAAAAAIVGASRFVRGYTLRHAGGIGELTDEQKAELQQAQSGFRDRATDDQILDFHAGHFGRRYEADSRREQGKRRRALAFGATAVVLGAAAGEAAHLAADHFINGGTASAIADKLPSGSSDGTAVDAPSDYSHLQPHDVHARSEMFYGHDTGGSDGGGGHVTLQESGPKLHELAHRHDSFHAHRGEGWFETMHDMGVPKDKWNDILNEAGPKLKDMGYAYEKNGEFFISRPGTLGTDALQTIADSSAKHGYAFAPISR